MKKIYSLLTFMFLTGFVHAQITLPTDFESSISTSDFTDFDGGVASVISNPVPGGINTSATVGQIVRNGGMVWAGSKLTYASTFDFSTLNSISMKVYTTAPAGTQIKLKLEGGATTFEVDAVTKTSGAWETLVWNFALAPSDETILAFMFDFGFLGDGTANSTFLFDDIEQVTSTATLDFPIHFESSSTVTSDFTDFDGGEATVLINPFMSGINTSKTVVRIIRDGGLTWAGSKLIFNGVNFDFSTNGTIFFKIYTSAPIGTPIRLKLEGSGVPIESDQLTTTTNEWETLSYDFTGQPELYNTLVFMPDIGTTGDGSSISTFYLDDIAFDCVPSANPTPDVTTLPVVMGNCQVTSLTAPTATGACGNTLVGSHNATLPITTVGITTVTWTYSDSNGNSITQDQTVDIDCSVGLIENAAVQVALYPNPVHDVLNIELGNLEFSNLAVYNHLGELVLKNNVTTLNHSIDVSDLPNGLYLLSVGVKYIRFVKV